MHPSEDDCGASTEMPRYVSHKKVWALEIDSIEGDPKAGPGERVERFVLRFRDKGYASIFAPAVLFSRYHPVAGDFYVVYQDGYKSFSPRKAFLEGYTRDAPKGRPTLAELEAILQEPDRPVNVNPDGSIS